ncbi:inhibitor of growth protein 3 [Ischnura elegans]|uniref:inhibitor of growth protein 3 n=1 Tax=Ischnura elegans TaxID=197161 RepID=UPI001ED89B96|nr:inhibitor of growth protein 3 [Ischnura elegans]
MLYLEDYLEMIEHLPQELRDRFTEMREMDLQVQNSVDSVEKRVKVFFGNAKRMKPTDKENEYQSIRKDYYKALEDADEKVHLANQMHDQVDRYLRRLDQELFKFKMELEADHRGITEVLEKRSLELDQPPQNSCQKENRYSLSVSRPSQDKKYISSNSMIEKKSPLEKVPEMRSQIVGPGGGIGSMGVMPANNQTVGYNLGHIGVGGNAIAAAASQAIAATQQMQQGRRTASLKASYEAINIGVHAHEFSIGRELAGAAQTAIAAIQDTSKKQKKQKTKTKRAKLWDSKYDGLDGAPEEKAAVKTHVNGHSNGQTSVQSNGIHSASTVADVAPPRKSVSGPMSSSTALTAVIAPVPSSMSTTSNALALIPSQPNSSATTSHPLPSYAAVASPVVPVVTTHTMPALSEPSPPPPAEESSTDQVNDANDDPDWTYDPNEPRYCICNQVSYGDMVACDNEDCPLEWFHYPCVGITSSPKGKWYCPQCTSSMKRRGSRK